MCTARQSAAAASCGRERPSAQHATPDRRLAPPDHAENLFSFLWHMHQPFYKDLVTGEYKLPWTRMHALKDYYGMVRILEEFPEIHQTFNLVPSMMVQIEEYAANQARDPFLNSPSNRPKTSPTDEKRFMLRNFFLANPSRMIHRYPRYGELFKAWQAQKHGGGWKGVFSTAGFPRPAGLVAARLVRRGIPGARSRMSASSIEKGRDFSLDDQALMGRKQSRNHAAW